MAFIFWIVLLLPAMGLYVLIEAMIAPFSGVLGPVLKLLNDPVFSYWASWVLLVWNVLVLAALGVHPPGPGLEAAGTEADPSGVDVWPVVGEHVDCHLRCFFGLSVILFRTLAKE